MELNTKIETYDLLLLLGKYITKYRYGKVSKKVVNEIYDDVLKELVIKNENTNR